jgi:hypothetical protein
MSCLWGGLIAQSVLAEQASPQPTCLGGFCTVTFDALDVPYLWVSPVGATDLGFDVYGAQGGQGAFSVRSTGLGGRVSGLFTSTPSQLLVYVGGRGVSASGAPGGFNGGGNAGRGRGDEGSGGGASDLRMTSALADRVVVAGGGGGAGGNNWAKVGFGGSGGSIDAEDGGWGTGGPGRGGRQVAGGASGRPDHGDSATSGQPGQGGNGSSSTFAGGGGGGGGYFGGGGGGSDRDNCCFGAGGGGGGSSYASSEITTAVKHYAGVREGDGLVILRYTLDPTPTPTPTPTASSSATETATPSSSSFPTSLPTSSPSATETPTPTSSSSPTPEPTQAAVLISAPSDPSPPPAEPSYPSPTALPPAVLPDQATSEVVVIQEPPSVQASVQQSLQQIESLPLQVESKTVAAALPDTKVFINKQRPAIKIKPAVNSTPIKVAERAPLNAGVWLILGLSTVGLGLASYALLRNLRSSLGARRRRFVLVS